MIERIALATLLVALGVVGYRLFVFWRLRRAGRADDGERGRPAVLYFRSDHCAPCVAQKRFLEQVQAAYGERLAIESIDADVQLDQAQRYGIFTLPTTLIVDAGGVVRHANYGLADDRKLAMQLEAVLVG